MDVGPQKPNTVFRALALVGTAIFTLKLDPLGIEEEAAPRRACWALERCQHQLGSRSASVAWAANMGYHVEGAI